MGIKRQWWVYKDKRWPACRLHAKRRDGWQCVQCGSRYRLEVDHIQPVVDAPELAFAVDNLQTLCGRCHGRKTQIETGNKPAVNPKRLKWLKACDELTER